MNYPTAFEQKHMGTRVTVTAHPGGPARDLSAAAGLAFGVFAGLERRFSLFRPDSEIAAVNAAAGSAVTVSPQFMDALVYALELADETGGVFDPLVGVLTAPGRAAVTSRRPGYRDISVDRAAGTVTLPPGGVLDLNSVVKGSALDLALAAFGGDEAVMIEAGGDIVVRGLPPGRTAWDIGVRDPRHPEKLIAVLPVRSGAICTSGDYFRGATALAAGRRHLVDARSGRPSGGMTSMTVLAPTAREADALSTAAFLLPPYEAAAFVERHPGAGCLFVDAAGQVFASPRVRSVITSQIHA